ncbi:MAG: LuxR C-terminal-related transcriptional regulator, partial [Rhodococcus sp. (in: high G+C Gram-positive bacteria)]
AESTAARAAATLPPRHPEAARIALLRAWASMLAGNLAEAQARLDVLDIPLSHSRNRLYLHAMRVGLARRSGDTGSLLTAWEDAQDIIAQYSVDLLSFLPVGELWLGAVRVGQLERMSHLITQAEAVAENLHEPSAWTAALHWYGVQAAIAAEHPPGLVPHARALAAAAESNQYSAALATAGRAWLAVLQGHPDAMEVEAAAQGLARIALSWDGARLASEAALRVADTRAATTLLQVARSLRQPVAAPSAVAEEPKGSLSAREAEVAELLVLGVTYREAGARLYISAKTVEHHVARIRRRLGAGSRSELLSMLRAMGYGSTGSDEQVRV